MPYSHAVCLLALSAHIAAALLFQAYVFSSRTSLPEADDAYTYILKSTQIAEGCGLQDCAALKTLRAQLATKSQDEDAEWRRYRLEGRVFLVYHPLYSVALLALNKAGLSWEAAFAALSGIGVVLIGAGMAFFLATLWGPAAAALALLLLAFSNFPAHGLTSIVPSNMALGIGFLAWGFALRGWRWCMVAAVAALLLMHPVGKVYSGVAVLLAFAMDWSARPRALKLSPYLAASALIGASAILPLLIDQPMLRLAPEPAPAGFTLLHGLFANIWKAARVMASGFGRGPAIGIPLAFAVYWLAWRGLRSMPDATRRPAMITGLLLAGMCAALLAHVMPHYAGEAFMRAWIALAAFAAGAAAYAMVGPNGILMRPATAGPRGWRDPARLCSAFLVVFAVSGTVALVRQAAKIRDRHYETFEPDQVRQLAARCGTALYADGTAAIYYLAQGASGCPSLFLPALKGSPARAAALTDLSGPLTLVGAKPGPREIALSRRSPATFALGAGDSRTLHLKLAPSSPDAMLRVHVTVAGRKEVREIAAASMDSDVVVTLPPGPGEKTVSFEAPMRGSTVYLEGLSLDDAPQGWPWNAPASLAYLDRVYRFSAPDLTEGLFPSMEVIDSRGSTFLAKLNAPN